MLERKPSCFLARISRASALSSAIAHTTFILDTNACRDVLKSEHGTPGGDLLW